MTAGAAHGRGGVPRRSAAAPEPGRPADTGPEPDAPGTTTVRDEVDRIVEAWGRVRPDLDVTPLTVLSRVSRLSRHLDLARRGAFARHELETWEFDVLSALRRAGAPYRLSPGALLTQTLVTSGTMTNRIDRLAERGLVERQPSPEDRRGVLVQLTDVGLARVDAAFSDLLDVERRLLAALTEDEHTTLATLLRDVVAPFDAP
jgi:DNA-binding MarR family transcriptional regulator